ncbi:hypothetical protein [Sphingobium sp. B11D3D]|uniref:phosphorylase family protein n=1 Tax=Sphingobium sp. B11D3D TaxID=2940576 RepID=UPI0022247253|nr:hypothetical protein [Sphingobium sp. B11D3D]MCW2370062.1 nucleoside phosphorylase/CheY-like chemotaxis protein [Sphingobium sp. B11D3D]
MRILIVDDDDAKVESIKELITIAIPDGGAEIVRTETINDTLVKLGEGRFDLVVVDLMLPQIRNGDPVDATNQWCELIEHDLVGRTASWIVMTAYAEIAGLARESFARHNVAVIKYETSSRWDVPFTQKLRETYSTRPLDFLIVCALEKERQGFVHTKSILGEKSVVVGLDCQLISIGKFRGMIVVQPGPGMISAAMVTTKALMTFRPSAVAMSGICGGREGETELGALIVPDLSWNYQSGKFIAGKLTPDLLQVQIPPNVRTRLIQKANSEYSKSLRNGLLHLELVNAPIQVGTMVSGSQVVADPAVGALIAEQGRKVIALDMEVASMLLTARDFYDGGGIIFAAKTVVDLANPHKDDRYHDYGCAVSARFVSEAINELLSFDASHVAL